MSQKQTIQLGEICKRLEVRERDARYVLEQRHVPKGVEKSPDSGHYRQFDLSQAFWLGMVLKLKQFGIAAPLSEKIANYSQQSLRTVTKNLGWDWGFDPSQGRFDTDHEYHVELAGLGVAGLEYIRFGTNASPSRGGRFEYFDWHRIDKPGDPIPELRPCTALRLNLSLIAQLLAGAFDDRTCV